MIGVAQSSYPVLWCQYPPMRICTCVFLYLLFFVGCVQNERCGAKCDYCTGLNA